MNATRLLNALSRIEPEQAERLFGIEAETHSTIDSPAPIQRVAIFAESFLPKVDGVSKTAFLALRHLQQTGREVLVFAPDTAPEMVGGSHVVRLPSFGFPGAPETRVALPNLIIGNALDRFKPDVIQLFSPAVLSANGMFAGRRRGIPVIANYQTDLPAYAHHYGYSFLSRPTRDWLRFIHNGCHLTLVPSHSTLRELQGWGFRRLRRWGRGVNSIRFTPARRSQGWRERLLAGRDPNALLCVYVGRLAHEKRVDLLLEVARTPGVALTIIGDGALREDLERQFAGTGTHFMGYLYGEELADAFAAADVFCFPGPSETFGQVVQEALASGLPAVVVNAGGVVDLVEEGKTGYICEPSSAAFAAAVLRLRDDPALRRQMSVAARAYAEARPWSAIMAQLEGHYAEAISLNLRQRRIQPPKLLSTAFLTRVRGQS